MINCVKRVQTWIGLGMAMTLLVAGAACNATFPNTYALSTSLPLPLPAIFPVPPAALDEDRFIGGNAQRFLIARDVLGTAVIVTVLPDLAPSKPVRSTKVVAVNLETLAVEPIMEQIGGILTSTVSDGHWLVWDDSASGLAVRDLDTGAESRLFEDLSGLGTVWPVVVDGGRLVARARNFSVFQQRHLFVIVDLASGDQRLIGPAVASGGSFTIASGGSPLASGESPNVALSGDRLVFDAWPAFDVATQPLAEFFGGRNIEHVDLATGEQKTLVSNLGLASGEGLWMAGTRVIWMSPLWDSGDEAVRSYDTQTDQIETVTSLPPGMGGPNVREWQFADAGPGGILVRQTRFTSDLGELSFWLTSDGRQSYEIRGFDGTSMPVIDFTIGFPDVAIFNTTGARMVGDYIVLRDPFGGDYVVHDTRTGSQRRFDPFAQLSM